MRDHVSLRKRGDATAGRPKARASGQELGDKSHVGVHRRRANRDGSHAMLVGAKADAWGRKPLFLIALCVLTIRGCLYPLSDNPYWLVGVQLSDGVGAGIYGAVFPVIVADLMRGTGRFNVAQGAIITAQGVGAALSTTLAGIVVLQAGYSAAFLTLAGVAIVGFALYYS